ncbi:DEKNAAC103656 [Brettanomyces naardenensis]|uniref:DEKNAAC103656 n=1 Tax=Brettanomyces naardenensis TaxID=13370 RepID=A0A448YN97_BRENA|nr:DEKNAAC103656 [Brettanomyces naardenensis]
MAGSQLKRLRATLKDAGLIGQTNTKRKGKKHSRKTPNETRREDRQRVIAEIREEFNPFDVKMTRDKRADALSKKRTVGKPGISKQIGQERRKVEWEAKMARKNKSGGIIDKRFGERNKNMTAEEKMLERFTKERLAHTSKYSLMDMDDQDEEGDDGEVLTHYGQTLGAGSGEGNGGGDEEEEDFFSKKEADEDEGPPRKKTKAEVMKEVIAKSKFYRQKRKEEKAKIESQVNELDDDFTDVMSDLRDTRRKEDIVPKTKTDIEYDKKVKEVALSGRAAPADRTKTPEELAQEKKENLQRLENQRLRRMRGEIEGGEVGADDVEDDFWEVRSDEDEANGFTIREDGGEEEEEEEVAESEEEKAGQSKESRTSTITIGGKVVRVGSSSNGLVCPSNISDFISLVKGNSYDEVIDNIKTIFKKYQPKLANGNREKLGVFTGVLIEYTLKLSDDGYSKENKEEYTRLMEFLTKLIRDLAAKYPEQMLEFFREPLRSVQQRIESRDYKQYPKRSDLVLFTIIGRTFSTSDMYHLLVTPTLVVMGESLEFLKIDRHVTHLFAGLYICDLLLQYERISKRIIPEVINFLERAILVLTQEPERIQGYEDLATSDKQPAKTMMTLPLNAQLPESLGPISLSSWTDSSETQREVLLLKSIVLLDKYISLVFKESTAFIEICSPFVILLRHLVKYYARQPFIPGLLKKIENVRRIAIKERRPLKLQAHRPLAIATHAPKFEENYNPDKKYYDTDRSRQEIGKLRHQIKEERKQTMRELRRDTEFEARTQIDNKRKHEKEYHEKMARLMNSIQTEEGEAKNTYEKEKRRRAN